MDENADASQAFFEPPSRELEATSGAAARNLDEERYDTRCYFNSRSKADTSSLIYRVMTCLRWILGYKRLEIGCKIRLSGD